MTKQSFILHDDSLSILDKMSDEQAGKFIKLIRYYRQNNSLPDDVDFAIDMAITPFINQFIRDEEKWQNVREKRIEAGSKGGKQKVANASKCKQKVANVAVSVNVNDNVNKNEIKKKGFKKPSPLEVSNYCKERGKGIDPDKWFDYYSSNGWKVGKNSMKDWKAAVRTWEGKSFGDSKPDKSTVTTPHRLSSEDEARYTRTEKIMTYCKKNCINPSTLNAEQKKAILTSN